MEIVDIFAPYLFVFHYEDEIDNEFDRLMDLWTDVGYLQSYAKRNNVKDIYGFIENVVKNAEQIQDLLNEISGSNLNFEQYFEALQESENGNRILALQKGKINKNQLRIYAIKIDSNCFVITGGAIKMSQKMDEHPDTKNELIKLKKARLFLNQNGIIDEDSFFELLNEQI